MARMKNKKEIIEMLKYAELVKNNNFKKGNEDEYNRGYTHALKQVLGDE